MCERLNPVLDRAADESGKYLYLKVCADSQDAADLFWDFEVKTTPTIVITKDGK